MSYVDRERLPFGSRKAFKRVYAYAWAMGGVAVGAAQADRQVSRHARRVGEAVSLPPACTHPRPTDLTLSSIELNSSYNTCFTAPKLEMDLIVLKAPGQSHGAHDGAVSNSVFVY